MSGACGSDGTCSTAVASDCCSYFKHSGTTDDSPPTRVLTAHDDGCFCAECLLKSMLRVAARHGNAVLCPQRSVGMNWACWYPDGSNVMPGQ